MSVHAPIAPSALALTVACPASVGMQASVTPLPPIDEELEGTAAHWIAQQYAAGYARDWPVGAKFKSGGQDWTVDLDMVTGATMYAAACGGLHPDLRLEDSVRISEIHPLHCWGTPDAWRFFPNARLAFTPDYITRNAVEFPREWCETKVLDAFNAGKLKVLRDVDYKYGHRYVEVFGNFQLIGYASGVMERLQLSELDDDLWLHFVIVQPRCFHKDGSVRHWIVHVSAIRAYLNQAASAAREALGEGASLRDGKPRAITNEGCLDCKANHDCAVFHRLSNAIVEYSGSAERIDMPITSMGQQLAMVDVAMERLEARRTGLAARVKASLSAGVSVPYYHLTPGESRLVYKDDVDVDEFVGFAELCNVEVRKKPTKKDLLVTPKQAIQLGIDATAMTSYAHRPPAALKLARDDSLTVSKVFSK